MDKTLLFDSGASISLVNDSSLLDNVVETSTLIHVAGAKTVLSNTRGTIKFDGHDLECLFLPESKDNIISVGQLHEVGFGVFSLKSYIVLLKLSSLPSKLIDDFIDYMSDQIDSSSNNAMIFPYEGRLPYVRLDKDKTIEELQSTVPSSLKNSESVSSVNLSDDFHIISKLQYTDIDLTMDEVPSSDVFRAHCALGHMHYKSLKKLGFEISAEDLKRIKRCKTCAIGKFTLKPTTAKRDHTSTRPFEQLHMDTAFPSSALGVQYYVVLLIDDYSRYMKVFVVKDKGMIRETVDRYIEAESKVRGYYPRFITTDKGKEFSGLGYEFTTHYDYKPEDVKDIPYINVAPTGNKQFNGLAERGVRTLKTIRSLLVSHLRLFYQEKYLVESYLHAETIYNRSPHSGIDGNIPFGRYFNRKSKPITDVDLQAKEDFISSQPAHLFLNIQSTLPELPMFLEDGVMPRQVGNKTILEECFFIGYDLNDTIKVMRKSNHRKYEFVDKTTQFKRFGTFQLHQDLPTKSVNEIYLQYESEIPFTNAECSMLKNVLDSYKLGARERIYCVGETDNDMPIIVPRNFKEAISAQEWLEAIQKEIDSFIDHNVYSEVKEKLANAKYLHTFWLFSRKMSGVAKARLITIDPPKVGHRDEESSSPVVKQRSLFLIYVKFAKEKSLYFSTYDISTAFLNSLVPENEIYLLRTPLGFGNYFSTKFVRMNRFAYGLNVSPLRFHETLSEVLQQKYRQSVMDRCIHQLIDSDEMVAHHVDDLLVLSSNPQQLETLLAGRFNLKISREPKFYLGYDFRQSSNSITLGLSTYLEKAILDLDPVIRDVVQMFTSKPFTSIGKSSFEFPEPTVEAVEPLLNHLENENPYSPDDQLAKFYEMDPLEEHQIELPLVQPPTIEQRATKNQSNRLHNSKKPGYPIDKMFTQKSYQSIVGILSYLVNKGRFDLQVYTNFLAQFNAMPSIVEYRHAVHLLQFAFSTRYSHYKFQKDVLPLDRSQLIQLHVYTDASNREKSSQGGYVILLDGHYIESKSYRLRIHTSSSFEAELLALRRGVVQVLSIIPALRDIGYTNVKISAFCDNLPVIKQVENKGKDDGDYSLIYRNCLTALRWHYKYGRFHLFHVRGKVNPADLFTKPLNSVELFRLLRETELNKTFQLIVGKPKRQTAE